MPIAYKLKLGMKHKEKHFKGLSILSFWISLVHKSKTVRKYASCSNKLQGNTKESPKSSHSVLQLSTGAELQHVCLLCQLVKSLDLFAPLLSIL